MPAPRRILHLDVDAATTRLRTRGEHFMDERLIQSQFATLETPTDDETDVIVVDAILPLDGVVTAAAVAVTNDLAQGRQT